MQRQYVLANILYFLLIFNIVGTGSSIFQKFAVIKVKDNIELNPMILILELSFIAVGIFYG
jgi:hypothetical protein